MITYKRQPEIDAVKAEMEEHRRTQHTEEYERSLRQLPPRPWSDKPPYRLSLSLCPVCDGFLHLIAEIMNASEFTITLTRAERDGVFMPDVKEGA